MRETNEQRGDGPAVATDTQSEAQPRLEAVPEAPPTMDGVGEYQSLGYRAKRLLLGPPFKTTQLVHERISKRVALAVFSSDPISSTAYATEEMLLVLLAWGNLRGIRESGRIFAIPTYVYILSLGGVVVFGVYRVLSGSIGPIVYDAAETRALAGATGAAVSLFLLMHAYAAGTTALTGVEAIADGVPAFRKPEARNAQRTLTAMALIMGFLFIGITFLAIELHARPFQEAPPTLVAQIAQHVLGSGIGHVFFVFVQVATLFI